MTPRERLGIGAASLALEKLRFDVVLGHELFNRITNYFRHRHRFDEIRARLSESFSFRRVDGDGPHNVGTPALRSAPHEPDARQVAREVLAIARGLGTIELDRGAARIVKRCLALLAQ